MIQVEWPQKLTRKSRLLENKRGDRKYREGYEINKVGTYGTRKFHPEISPSGNSPGNPPEISPRKSPEKCPIRKIPPEIPSRIYVGKVAHNDKE